MKLTMSGIDVTETGSPTPPPPLSKHALATHLCSFLYVLLMQECQARLCQSIRMVRHLFFFDDALFARDMGATHG